MNNLRKHHLGIKLLLLALFLAALPTRVLSAEEQTGRLTVMLPDTVTDQLPASPAPEIAFTRSASSTPRTAATGR